MSQPRAERADSWDDHAGHAGRFAAIDPEKPRSCPHGHPMTKENTRVRWIRGRAYPLRECRICIRAKAAARRGSEAGRAYHAQYQRDHYAYGGRHGSRVHVPSAPPKLIPLSADEIRDAEDRWSDKDGLYREHVERMAARWKRRFGWQAARQKLMIESIRAETAEKLAIASQDPELATLIAEQARDDASFNIKRPAIFVPQARADALLYGTFFTYER